MSEFKITGTSKSNEYIQVDYFGLTIDIPLTCRFITTDMDGDVYAYIHEPEVFTDQGMWRCTEPYSAAFFIISAEYEGEYEHSLLEINHVRF